MENYSKGAVWPALWSKEELSDIRAEVKAVEAEMEKKEKIQTLIEMGDIFKPTQGSGLELRSCPFCGGSEIYYVSCTTTVGVRWKVVCGECMGGADTGWAQQPSQIMDVWNRRAE